MSSKETILEEEEEEKKPKLTTRKKHLLIGGGIALLALIILTIVLSVVLTRKPKPANLVNRRIDCLPWLRAKSDKLIQDECKKLESYCLYEKVKDSSEIPACYFNKDKIKMKLVNQEETKMGKAVVLYGGITNDYLRIEFEYLDDKVLRFKIYKPNEETYEVPIEVKRPSVRAKHPNYEIQISNDLGDFNFKILRKSTKTVLWDTSIGPIIFEKLKRVISTRLPSSNVYGMGENKHESFKHKLNYQNWPVFARDQIAEDMPYANLYGSQPFYTCMENDGNSHGVVMVNSNAFDYELIPEPGLVYRVTGGVLDFYMFLGPEPENVVQQYTEYFGRSFMPPYWALGFQVSRYGYKDLDDMKQVLDRFKQHQIPLDTQVADIDHYDLRRDFTIDQDKWKELPEYFDYLHSVGMKTVMILDPAVVVNFTDYWPYTTGKAKDVFIRWPYNSPDFKELNSSIMLGFCWPPGKVAYPDFFKSSTKKWWIDSIQRHHKALDFDGIWIDMNEPAVFGTNEERPFNWPKEQKPYWSLKCPDDEYENVQIKASYLYKSKNKLSDKTLCMSARQGEKNEYRHFDVHNLYGLTESVPTFDAARKVTNTRGFVITRSTFIGSGKYGGHWTGDNHSLWTHLRNSIIGMLEFNLFGIPFVGADICGFFENTSNELCARWSELGAFYPFSRNHNGILNIDQDPGALGEPVITSAKKALEIRYKLLPYYYTLFYKAHMFGTTVARPLFHEFPRDESTYSIDRQFLIGPALLISPVLDEGTEEVNAYFPADQWYSYYDGSKITNDDTISQWKNLSAPITLIPLHVRAGFIVPTQEPANTTEFSRQNPFGLIVAPSGEGEAHGDLFYDNGLSQNLHENYFFATFTLRNNKLKMSIEHNTYSQMASLKLDQIRLFISADSSLKFIKNKNTILPDESVKISDHEVLLSGLGLNMSMSFELEWTKEVSSVMPSRDGPLVDCLQSSKEECERKGCEFNEKTDFSPWCTIKKNKGGYQVVSKKDEVYELKRADDFALFGEEIESLLVEVSHGDLGENDLKCTRIQITDKNDAKRYRVPVDLNFNQKPDKHLNVNIQNSAENNKVYFEVLNKDGKLLFDTKQSEHGFIYSNQFIQLVLNLGYKNLYGFGENSHYSFKHQFSHRNWWGLFARDQPPGGQFINLYGTHPFFMAIDELSGRAFGLLVLNSNAQEYGTIPPSSFAYRTLGGIIDMYIMEESSPERLIQAYTSLLGKPYLPPYWSLGFQLSRYGYNKVENIRAAVDRTINANIPLDVQYADIDHFRKQLDFTYDTVNFKGLPEYINELRSKGVKFIIILDPAINSEEPSYSTFIKGKENDVYIKWPADQNPQKNETSDGENQYILGYVWPEGKTVFPDFFKNRTKKWWLEEIKEHYHNTLTFDGLWIDMNEPANFDTNKDKPFNWPKDRPDWNLHCPNNKYDDPPYLPLIARPYGNKERMSDKTLCMRTKQGENDEFIHYDVHNLFGWSQTKPTLDALSEILQKRSIVISRSTYPSSGKYSGHWLGDNTSIWPHLKQNIIGLLEFNLFGIPYIGADICGFFADADSEMCTRWMQLGAFNTFFRNHNGLNGIVNFFIKKK